MSFEIKKAVRQGIIPLIILYGGSNRGKTFSALLLARGMAGKNGIVRGVDTENKRMSIFADEIEGGFEVVDLDEPFTPDRYLEAVTVAASGASALVIDSGSHSWEGEGGVLEKAEESKAKSQGLHNYLHKTAHSRMLRALCRMPIPVIICLRGKDVYRQVRNDKGKTEIIKDANMAPVQDKHFIYEAVVALEMVKNEANEPGYCRIEKYTSAHLLPLLPKQNERVTIEHGQKIAAWCRGGLLVESPELKAAKLRVWNFLKQTVKVSTPADAEAWLRSNKIFSAEQTLSSLSTVEQCEELFNKVTKIL